LQGHGGIPPNHQVSVSPIKRFAPLVDVFIGHVNSSYERRHPVNDHDFSMISVIESIGQANDSDAVKRKSLNTILYEFFYQTPSDAHTTEIVVKKTYLYPLFSFSNH